MGEIAGSLAFTFRSDPPNIQRMMRLAERSNLSSTHGLEITSPAFAEAGLLRSSQETDSFGCHGCGFA
jgi:hypothetical protein